MTPEITISVSFKRWTANWNERIALDFTSFVSRMPEVTDESQPPIEVSDFVETDTDSRTTSKLEADPKAAKCLLSIVLTWNGRPDKHTRANETVTHKLSPDGPLLADRGPSQSRWDSRTSSQ
jgi:hypothetical protein